MQRTGYKAVGRTTDRDPYLVAHIPVRIFPVDVSVLAALQRLTAACSFLIRRMTL
jgi:hypothetical protein